MSEEVPLCDPYFYQDPRFLFRASWLDRYMNRRRGVCSSELVNEIVFVYIFSILSGAAAAVATGLDSAPLIAGMAATLYLIPTFLKLSSIDGFRQAAAAGAELDVSPKVVSTAYSGASVGKSASATEGFEVKPVMEPTRPSSRGANPFDNVLISDYKYAPKRPAASLNPDGSELDSFFRVNWYNDPTDVFGKTQSQRMFVTQPSTTIPNDQDSYQNWLYKIPGKTCKEGNPKACYGGTNGGILPWLNDEL
jgi:hypothetical protein